MRHCSIADALFPRTRQRLLASLLLCPRQSQYAAELAARLGVRRSTLQRDLLKLTAVGILKSSRSGNRVYFQADESCPIFPELRSLLLKTTGLLDALRDELASLASRIEVAFVYGSIAAGTETAGSDIDLMIVGSVGLMDLVPLLDRATRTFRREVNPTVYTPAEFGQRVRDSRFVKSVLAKPHLFVLGTEDALEAVAGGETRRPGADGPH